MRILRTAHSKAICIVLKKNRPDDCTTDDKLYHPHTTFLPVPMLLRFKRLNFFDRLVSRAPIVVRAAVQNASGVRRSGDKLARQDLQWLRQFPTFSNLSVPFGEHPKSWENKVTSSPKAWKRQLRELLERIKVGDLDMTWDTGGDGAPGLGSRPLSVGGVGGGLTLGCPKCGVCKPAGRPYIAHCSRCWGRRAVESFYAHPLARCAICLKQFSFPRGFKTHRGGSDCKGSKCLQQYILSGRERLSEEVMTECDK